MAPLPSAADEIMDDVEFLLFKTDGVFDNENELIIAYRVAAAARTAANAASAVAAAKFAAAKLAQTLAQADVDKANTKARDKKQAATKAVKALKTRLTEFNRAHGFIE